MAAKKVVAEFDNERATKGTVRYTETEEDRDKQVIGKIYLKKSAVKKLGLKEDEGGIKVTIEPA